MKAAPDRLTRTEYGALGLLASWPAITVALLTCLCAGCIYKGGKVIDGTNLAIGITVPGTQWSINALDYVGGVRVAGQDSTHITVTNSVDEDCTYFGVVNIKRRHAMVADIEPLESSKPASE